MFKFLTLFSLCLFLPALLLAETIATPQLKVLPVNATGLVEAYPSAQLTINYQFNRSQGLFDIDLWKVGCLSSTKNSCSRSISKGRYVSLNKKKNCQSDFCRYSFRWVLGRSLIKESGDYYLRVCYLVKNQKLTQAVTCANSPNFTIKVTPSTKKADFENQSQLANLWQVIIRLLNR